VRPSRFRYDAEYAEILTPCRGFTQAAEEGKPALAADAPPRPGRQRRTAERGDGEPAGVPEETRRRSGDSAAAWAGPVAFFRDGG